MKVNSKYPSKQSYIVLQASLQIGERNIQRSKEIFLHIFVRFNNCAITFQRIQIKCCPITNLSATPTSQLAIVGRPWLS